MSERKQVVVLGLGRFGAAVARELSRIGHDVLALDNHEKPVQEIASAVTHAAQLDVADADALRAIGVPHFDTAIVAISSNLEASILATSTLEQFGLKRIIAKARDELHGSILRRVGAHRVVYPERETGIRLAHSFAAPGVVDYLDVGPGYGIAKIPVAPGMAGKTLGEVDLRSSCGVAPLALYRAGSVTLNPGGSERLKAGDELIVAGLDEDLERLPSATGNA